MKRTHYDTLGVAPDASPGDIKRAFRKKSSKAHPDKGGDGKEQAEINRAYAVISQPETRKAYDDSGYDNDAKLERTAEENARTVLASLFGAAILEEGDPIQRVRDHVKGNIGKGAQANMKIAGQIEKLRKRRDRVKTTTEGAVNMLQAVIDARIAEFESTIAGNETQIALGDLLLEMLDGYRYEPGTDELIFVHSPLSSIFSTSTSGGWR